MSVHAWEEIIKQIEQEGDTAKIAELTQKLNSAMVNEEREKVKRRLGISPCQKEARVRKSRPPRNR
jgi:hypothetical protein